MAPLLVVGPTLRQLEPPTKNRIALLPRMMEAHRHLAVARLAQRPRALPRDPDGILTLLGEAGIVHQPNDPSREMILTVLAFDIPTSPADIKAIGAGQTLPKADPA